MNEIIKTISPQNAKATAGFFSTQGKFEHIPKWLNLFPIVAQWIWLGIKYRSITLPSLANPHITSGGMVGDGKIEYFETMGAKAKSAIADYVSFQAKNAFAIDAAVKQMNTVGLKFPIVAKPNLSWCGYGVRLIKDAQALKEYVSSYPDGELFLLQRFIPDEGEAGIFYFRYPDEDMGQLMGILLRFYPKVIGNGENTILEFIEADIRLRRLINNDFHKPDFDLNYIPKVGETVRLSLIGSTRIGGLYRDGTEHKTPALAKKMDMIAKDMKDFHIGRFDVRYKTIEDLEKGDFTIIEVNGSGSEAVHAWDPKYTISQVYKMVFAKQRILFSLSHQMRKRGYKPIGLFKLAKLHFSQQKLMRNYPFSN